MNIEQVREYCLSKPHTEETFPFDQNTLVFKVAGKMFALAPLDKWESGLASLNLKADPDYAIELRADYQSIESGWHMSKKHWNSVYIYKGELHLKFIMELIDHSYDMVIKGMTKKMRQQLDKK
ncbi:MmcQ/YjbR family DNA-binding protein [Lacinutrix sp. Bg11-31]|uniref:MmcQ/YjbR family DNA-binding protein n=1 Tax=Lacinutrix sp. Bg11-31 TaxID=2057808 RepID=UPI000C300821|nr:MmcQ/YjbR family DNA-binding protein [Lacinutrix sp. Bg11-31]AUC82566.1 MmcQ-like protein [Lacinutrix sp. Bg11-31]